MTANTTIVKDGKRTLTVLGFSMIQIQIDQDFQDAYIDLSRKEARELAKTLIDHCDKGDELNSQ